MKIHKSLYQIILHLASARGTVVMQVNESALLKQQNMKKVK